MADASSKKSVLRRTIGFIFLLLLLAAIVGVMFCIWSVAATRNDPAGPNVLGYTFVWVQDGQAAGFEGHTVLLAKKCVPSELSAGDLVMSASGETGALSFFEVRDRTGEELLVSSPGASATHYLAIKDARLRVVRGFRWMAAAFDYVVRTEDGMVTPRWDGIGVCAGALAGLLLLWIGLRGVRRRRYRAEGIDSPLLQAEMWDTAQAGFMRDEGPPPMDERIRELLRGMDLEAMGLSDLRDAAESRRDEDR